MIVALDDLRAAVFVQEENSAEAYFPTWRFNWTRHEISLGEEQLESIAARAINENTTCIAVASESVLSWCLWSPSRTHAPVFDNSIALDRITAVCFLPRHRRPSDKNFAELAIARANGTVQVLKLGDGTSDKKNQLFCAEADTFGNIATIRVYQPIDRRDTLRIGFIAGSGFGVMSMVRKAEGYELIGNVSVIQAHRWLVTDMGFSVSDETCATSSCDGSIYLWSTQKQITKIHVLREVNLERPIFALSWSPNGLLLAVLESTQGGAAAGKTDGNDAGKAKFQTVTPRSAVLVGRPSHDQRDEAALVSRSLKFADSIDENLPIAMWDLAQVLHAVSFSDENALAQVLSDEVRRGTGGGRRQQAGFYIANWYAQLAGSKVSEFRDALRKSLRLAYCESALKKLCDGGESELSEKEQMSIMRMSSIVSGTNAELGKQAMQRTDQRLAKPFTSSCCKSPIENDTGVCSSCSTLVVRWCVLTLLPLRTTVGRSCIGCRSDAEAIYQIGQEFDWLPDKLRCPYCSMPLRSTPIFNHTDIQ
ncbi:hypothetical protein NDN08_007895 [Rhodosorus marinus]|uniref:Transcription factor IIIC 90kDa subunit N-terminal domain-containing protein n=1 Tax=Rhodosorus marinus TaxID=101924 RepID=A0AAV8UYW2_9RHOD|nr:hypothetical protein NDN08_007895 [Rhodosorus marinus]